MYTKHELLTEEVLRELYFNEDKNMLEICKTLNCDMGTLRKYFRKYNIEKKPYRYGLVGKTFHNLEVIKFHSVIGNNSKWTCKCTCGAIVDVWRSSLTSGQKSCGCLKIEKAKELRGPKYTTEEFIQLANTIHNYRYTYENFTYEGCNIPSYITCLKHGDFSQTPHNHTQNGCPKCNTSYGERLIEDYLNSNNIQFQMEFRIPECKSKNPLPFDFAIWIDGKLGLIEFNGQQHYTTGPQYYSCPKKLKSQQKRDLIKSNYCSLHKIPLLVIPYWDKENIPKILEQWLSKF